MLGPAAVPSGTVVELGEATPATVPGGVWQTPVWTVTGTTTDRRRRSRARRSRSSSRRTRRSTSRLTDTLVGQGRFSVAKSVDDAGLGSPDTFTFQWWVDDVQQSPDLVVASDGTVPGSDRRRPRQRRRAGRGPARGPGRRHLDGPDLCGHRWRRPRPPSTAASRSPSAAAAPSARCRSPTWSSPTRVVLGGFAVRKVVAGATAEVPTGALFTGHLDLHRGRVHRDVLRRVVGGGRWHGRRRRVPRRDRLHRRGGRGPAGRRVHVRRSRPPAAASSSLPGDPAIVGLVTATNTYDDDAELAATGADGCGRHRPWRLRSPCCSALMLTLAARRARRPPRQHD